MKIILLFLMLSLFATYSFAGKTRCKPLLDKLQNIQAQQRSGYTAKQGTRLQNRADTAREKWWRCENSMHYVGINKKKAKKSQLQTRRNNINNKPLKVLQPFATSKAIVVRSRFKGEQQQAWLDFYEKPEKCKKVKSTKVFAYCMEDKAQQQITFSEQYGH